MQKLSPYKVGLIKIMNILIYVYSDSTALIISQLLIQKRVFPKKGTISAFNKPYLTTFSPSALVRKLSPNYYK